MAKIRNVVEVDEGTGEIISRSILWNGIHKRKHRDFVMSFQSPEYADLFTNPLSYKALRVLGIIMARHVGNYNYIFVTQATIAAELTISQSSVSRAIRELVKRNVLHVIGKGKLRLDPSFGWKGRLAAKKNLEVIDGTLSVS